MKSNSKVSVSSQPGARRFRRTLLASACALTLGAPAAFAQTATYTFNPALAPAVHTPAPSLSAYIEQVLNNQINLGLLTSNIGPINFVQTVPLIVTGNTKQTLATGNFFAGSSTVDVAGANKTIGVLSGQAQVGSSVTTTATDVTGGVALTGLAATTNTVTGNTIQAATSLNSADLSIAEDPDIANSGELQSGWSDPSLGSLSATEGAIITTTTTGSLVVSNNQVAFNSGVRAGSDATIATSTHELSVSATPGGTLDQNQTLSDNSIAAQYQANNATSTIALSEGSAPLNGSAAVGNFQGNLETGGAGAVTDLTASVSGSSVTADYRDGGIGVTSLSAASVTSNNNITAFSTGNTADSSLTLAKGVDLDGTAVSGTVNNLSAVAHTADVDADLGLLSVQGNSATGLNSSVTGGTVQMFGDNVVAGGSVTLSGNVVASSVEGNGATNLIQTQATNLSGSVAAGNIQINDGTTMVSTTSGAEVSSNIGTLSAPATGAITLDTNVISASSTGSSAGTTVQLDATHLALTSTAGGATVDIAGDGVASTTTGTGASLANFQGNYGATTPITAQVSDSNVRADFFDQVGGTARTSLDAANVSTNGNVITATATGTTATNALALGTVTAGFPPTLNTADASGSAALANGQLNENLLTATVTDSGVRISALDAADSNLTANSNIISASGTANTASNSLTSDTSSLTVRSQPLGATGTAVVDTALQTSSSNAALALVSSQKNTGSLTVANTSVNPFVVIDVNGGAGLDTSNLTVSSNEVSATGSGNVVTNTLGVTTTDLATSDGVAGQVAGISNLQQNVVTGTASARLEKIGGGVGVGITYDGPVLDSNLTVSNNTASASITGNTAGNTLDVAAVNYGGATAGGSGTLSSTPATGINLADAEFALVNAQVDAVSGGRTGIVDRVTVGIETGGGDVTDSNLTVGANTISANARNNDAGNTLALSATNLSTSAGLLNNQGSTTDVTAAVRRSRIELDATGGITTGSALSIIDNSVQAEAVGNAGSNMLSAAATNLSGNTVFVTGIVSATDAGLLSASSQFGLGSVQTMTGDVSSAVQTAIRMDVRDSDVLGGSLTISGNKVQSVAQSNSVGNTVELTGVPDVPGGATNINTSAAVASFQSGTGVVSAVQTTQSDNRTFGILGRDVSGTPIVVSGNSIISAAGQNESDNQLTVSGTNVTGLGFNTASTFNPATGVATTGSDFAVLNLQTGLGSVSASATPGLIGTGIRDITGGSVAVNDNIVVALATVNNARNALLLNGSTTLDATGAVNNAQVSTAGAGVNATVSSTTIGVAPPVSGASSDITGTPVTVSNNLITASAGGNTATNSLSATSTSSIGGSAAIPTFSILNYQSNAAGMTSLIDTVSIGLPLTVVGSSITNSNLSISGNQVLALGYGNSASNSLISSALTGTSNMSSASISNTQLNTGAISVTVSNVNLGVTNPITSAGVTGVVSGNNVTAQAIGNSATSSLTSK